MKIKKVVLKLNEFMIYDTIALNNYPIGILSEFLCHFHGNDDFIKEVQDPLLRCSDYPGVTLAGYGEIWFARIDDNLELIISWDSDFENEPEKKPLLIPVDQFVYIAQEWVKLRKLKKPYIMITEENNKYTIATFDENPAPEIIDK